MTLPRVSRLTAMLLIVTLSSSNLAFAAGKPLDAAAMNAKVAARGVGQGVRVTLADNTEANGLIASIGEQSFALKPKSADQARDTQISPNHRSPQRKALHQD